jgi:hypothetical protein
VQSKQIQVDDCLGIFADLKFFFRMYLSAPVDGDGRVALSHFNPPHLAFKQTRSILENCLNIVLIVLSNFIMTEAGFNGECH